MAMARVVAELGAPPQARVCVCLDPIQSVHSPSSAPEPQWEHACCLKNLVTRRKQSCD